MRVSLPHLGHAVDFVVSMTFFRSAVFAIFAILVSHDRNVPPASGPRFYLVIGEYPEAQHRRLPEWLEWFSNRPGRANTRRSGALYSPIESYTNCGREMGV